MSIRSYYRNRSSSDNLNRIFLSQALMATLFGLYNLIVPTMSLSSMIPECSFDYDTEKATRDVFTAACRIGAYQARVIGAGTIIVALIALHGFMRPDASGKRSICYFLTLYNLLVVVTEILSAYNGSDPLNKILNPASLFHHSAFFLAFSYFSLFKRDKIINTPAADSIATKSANKNK